MHRCHPSYCAQPQRITTKPLHKTVNMADQNNTETITDSSLLN